MKRQSDSAIRGTGAQKRVKYPSTLPCGCRTVNFSRETIVVANGNKVCRHGLIWKLAWTKIGRVPIA